MAEDDLRVEHFFVGPLQMRCSVVTHKDSGDTIIIDGGDESGRIIEWIDQQSGQGPDAAIGAEISSTIDRKVVGLVNTHAHFDHSGHVPFLIEHYGVDWYLHDDDTFLQTLAQQSARRYGINLPTPAVATQPLMECDNMSLGHLTFRVIHTPGHTLGGCCLLFEQANAPAHLFVGDTLFAGSVGRTDIANSGGDFALLSSSIREKLWPLPLDTIVHPGHGPLTTIGEERKTNPYVGDSTGDGVYGFGKYA